MRILALGALLVALAVLAAACGDDDAATGGDGAGAIDLATVRRYARDLEAAKAELDADRPPTLNASSPAEVAPRLRQENEALVRFASALGDLAAPTELATRHKTFASYTDERVDTQTEMADRIEEENEFAEDDPDRREAAFSAWIAARCDLEQGIRELGVEVSLGCTVLDIAQEQTASFDRPSASLPLGRAACTAVTEPREEIEYGQTVYTVFVNAREEPVNLYRYNASLERELITTLGANEETLEVHLLGAGWLVTELDESCIGGTRPLSIGFTVTIPPAPPVE